jgi:hypothetical protein
LYMNVDTITDSWMSFEVTRVDVEVCAVITNAKYWCQPYNKESLYLYMAVGVSITLLC